MFCGVYQALLATALALLVLQGDAATVSIEAAMIANGWFAERHASFFPVANIDWDYYTYMTYVWA